MALNPEDLRGFELLDEPEDPPPPATLLVQSDRKVENKYNKTWWETKVTKRSEATKSAYSFNLSPPGTINAPALRDRLRTYDDWDDISSPCRHHPFCRSRTATSDASIFICQRNRNW